MKFQALFLAFYTQTTGATSISQVCQSLFQTLQSDKHLQATDQNYFGPLYPPFQWERQKGIYDSSVHLNFHGKLNPIRGLYSFPDDNMFVTANVLEQLFEAASYSNSIVKMDSFLMGNAINAILTHRDKNDRDFGTIYNFWNQVQGDDGHWRAGSANIANPLGQLNSSAVNIVDFLTRFPKMPADTLSTIKTVIPLVVQIFQIPADADDTGVVLALRSKSSVLKSAIPDTNALALDAYVRYAYQPFADDWKLATIDPRTYYWMRPFLESLDSSDKEIRFVSTWFQSLKDIPYQKSYQKMPFGVNNVDISVITNSLNGITSTLFDDPAKYISKFTPELRSLVKNSVDLLVWYLENNILEKNGITSLLYYPSRYSFLYFAARLSKKLNEDISLKSLEDQELSVLFESAASRIRVALQSSTFMSAHVKVQESEGIAYWDDFLGNADAKYDDRVHSTATAVISLIYAWTTPTSSAYRTWSPSTPFSVRKVVKFAANFLLNDADKYEMQNAFFSSSTRSQDTTPYAFISNVRKQLGASDSPLSANIPCGAQPSFADLSSMIVGVAGVIPEEEYSRLLKEPNCFLFNQTGQPDDEGNNCNGCVFPYWSAESFTISSRLLALTLIDRLV